MVSLLLPPKQECYPQRLVNNCPECTDVPTVVFSSGGFGMRRQELRSHQQDSREPFGFFPKALSVSCRCHMNGEKNCKKRIIEEMRRKIRLARFDQNLLISLD